MIIRRTHKTIKKELYRGKYETKKETGLYRVYTYWFLFIPIYSYEEFIN